MKLKWTKSFLRGYLRTLDLFGVTKEWPDITNDRTKDFEALRSDWDNVGRTIRRETRNFKNARG